MDDPYSFYLQRIVLATVTRAVKDVINKDISATDKMTAGIWLKKHGEEWAEFANFSLSEQEIDRIVNANR